MQPSNAQHEQHGPSQLSSERTCTWWIGLSPEELESEQGIERVPARCAMLVGCRALFAARAPSAHCTRSTRMSAKAHTAPAAAAQVDVQQQPQPSSRRRPSQGQLVERALQAVTARHALIDIGVNLMDKSFDKDRASVVERAQLVGCEASIITGSCIRTATAAAHFCEQQPSQHPLYFTAGVHPHNAKHCGPTALAELERLAAHPACVAVGECGLDFNRNFSPPEVQEEWFGKQVALAERLGMPLFVHCREAYPQLAAVLRQQHRSVPVVVHCFTGGREDLELMLGMGYYIGITGWVCDDRPDKGAAELAALVPLIPDDKLMIETDAPYLTPRTIQPSKQRPQRNEPALLPFVLERVAQARGQSLEHVARVTTQNAREFFRLNHGASS